MGTQAKPGFKATAGSVDPTWVKRHKQARAVYGISASLLSWRDKKAEGKCRMCLRPADVRALTLHHLVPEAWFRRHRKLRLVRNVAANLIPLCRDDHDLVEREATARSQLRRLLAPDEVAFAIQTAGRDWLDASYPLTGQSSRRREDVSAGESRPMHRRDCHPVFGCVYGCVFCPRR